MVDSGTENIASPRGSFVGRERELVELVSACKRAAEGDAQLFLIHGEPGIGKTRVADELASRARAQGMRVLWGRCREGEGAPAYWPWIQIVREFLGALDDRQRSSVLESEVASDVIHQVGQIVPELRTILPASRPSSSERLEPAEARFRLFDAVTNFLKFGARSKPLLIVLDDLHDADEASLAMLRFVARELKGAPIIIIATHRDVEVARSEKLSAIVGDLARDAHPIPLRGLGESEVRRFVEAAVGHAPSAPLVTKLRDATNGNPLFLDGIVRILIAENEIDSAAVADSRFSLPVGVREAIRRQLAALSPEAISLLRVAATIGKEFSFELCQSAAEASVDDARRALEEASRAGIVTVVDRNQYRFVHALIRDALDEGPSSEAWVGTHRSIAEHMEKIYREQVDLHLSDLAHHFREAGIATKAIEYSIRAGQAAVPVGANADAVMHWESALELMEAQGLDARPRAVLLEWLGDLSHAIDQAKSVRYREAAIALYESVGLLRQAAWVRVTLGRSLSTVNQPIANGARAIEHLRRAESVLARDPDTAELAWLYEGIASYEHQSLDYSRSAMAARRAMEIADRIGDKAAWSAAAGFYGFALANSGRLKEAFKLFDRSFEAAECANKPGSGGVAANFAGFCSCWLGDPRVGRAWYERELTRPRNARFLGTQRDLLPTLTHTYFEEGQIGELGRRSGGKHWGVRFWADGQWEASVARIEKAAEASERAGDKGMRSYRTVYLGMITNILGDYSRAEAHLQYGLDDSDRGHLVLHEMRVRPLLALTYVAMNRLDAAAEQVAIVAAARGDFDFASPQFETALAIHRKYHLAHEEAETLRFWGRALAAAGDRAGAAEKFDAAVELHRARGVGPRFLDYVRADKQRALGSSPTRVDLGAERQTRTAKSPPTGTFQKEGEFWTIAYQGITFRLKDMKGLSYMAVLLAHPGQRFHVNELVRIVEGAGTPEHSTGGLAGDDLSVTRDLGGDTPALDSRARADYRGRLKELEAELDEAERFNDIGRAERAREELEFLNTELASAAGFFGRAHQSSAHAERARVMVGRNIRAALDKIRRGNPALGRHFANSISTGYFCSYQPEPANAVSWQLAAE
jgi:tetratricopeptide (TPR) repeat protein